MIALACDHGGYMLLQKVKAHLDEKGLAYNDFGTYSPESCDYPDYAAAAAQAVAGGLCDRGILICTTGIGVSMTAGKIRGIRCALCSDTLSASLSRRHNDANMLALGAGIIGEKLALEIIDVWLCAEFEGGRHQRRLDKIARLENGQI